MIKHPVLLVALLVAFSFDAFAQNSNSAAPSSPKPSSPTPSSATPSSKTPKSAAPARPHSAATPAADTAKPTDTAKPSTTSPVARTGSPKPSVSAESAPGSTAVVAAFNRLMDGIRHADVKAVTGVYLNTPRLSLFNNNGTVTKGWEQLRKNRESSYPDVKDVKLETRDLSVTMLGRDGALVTCLWTQSQTYKGAPEEASGRMTLVFKRVGMDWKVIHLHTSPDKEDPTRVMPSEQTSPPVASPTPSKPDGK